MRTTYLLVFTLFFCFFAPFISADIIYVDDDATTGPWEGTQTNPYQYIQDAIDNSIDTDEIIVAEGVYNENIDMKGMEVMLRSTDPTDPNVVAATVIDGGNSGTVITCDTNETVDTIINGFWIQNGDGNVSTGNGGGVYCAGSYPVIENCVLSNNIAATGGYGGGIFCWQGAPTISKCIFIGNSIGSNGGGIACYESDPIVTNCVFSGNEAPVRGGGLYCYQSHPSVTNCTFSQNTAISQGGAIYCTQSSNPSVINCVMWGDSAGSGSEIYASSSSPTVSYSVIEGGWAGSGANNIDNDPFFIDADGVDDTVGTADDDLYLDPFSLCINAGDPNGDYWGLKDIRDYSRIRYGRVDIGAYEVFPIGGDRNEDGQVDLADLILFVGSDMWLVEVDLIDFSLLAGQWMFGVGDFIPGDLNEDGQVDAADLILFANSDNWLIEADLVDFAVLAKYWLVGVE